MNYVKKCQRQTFFMSLRDGAILLKARFSALRPLLLLLLLLPISIRARSTVARVVTVATPSGVKTESVKVMPGQAAAQD